MDGPRSAMHNRRDMNQRPTLIVATTLLAAAQLGYASADTKFLRTWREPSAGRLDFKKVLVMCIAEHESQRRFAEAELVRLMTRTKGVPAYSLLTQDEVKDEPKMRAVMLREAFDGAITLRVIGGDQKHTEQPGAYSPAYGSFWSYYGMAWPGVSMGYVHTDRRMHMETQVYSMRDDKLVWSGVTQTKNPKSAQQLVVDVARAVAADLRKQRLID
jgi:hypothetical protein